MSFLKTSVIIVFLILTMSLTGLSAEYGDISFATGTGIGAWSHTDEILPTIEYLKSRTGKVTVYIQGNMTSLEREDRQNYYFEYSLKDDEKFLLSEMNDFKIELKKDTVYIDTSVYSVEMKVKFFLDNNQSVEFLSRRDNNSQFTFINENEIDGIVTKIQIYPIYEVYDSSGNIKESPRMVYNNTPKSTMPISFCFLDVDSNVNRIDNITGTELTTSTKYSGTGFINGIPKYIVKLADKPLVYAKGVSMLFDSGINFKVYLEVDSSIDEVDYYVSVDGVLRQVVADENERYVLCEVAPKDLEDKTFSVKIILDSYEKEILIKASDYVEKISKESQEISLLMSALEDYATAAKVYFDKTEDMVITDPLNDDKIKDMSIKECTGTLPDGIKIVSTSLILENNIKIRHYLKIESGYTVDSFSFTLDDEELTVIKSGDLIYVEIEDVYITELDTPFVVSVSSRDSLAKGDIIYSVGSYMSFGVSNSNDEKLVNLLRKLYLYYIAALNYSKN